MLSKKLEQTITTVEIAEMMEISHKEILRKIEGANDRKGYFPILTENHLVPSDYFILSSYKDGSGKENKCYEVTKLGCDFLANKFTGEKGIVFTAKYVKRFHDMQNTIKNDSAPVLKEDKEKVQLMNARSRMANTYLKLAKLDTLSKEYKNILVTKAAEVLNGHELLPLPKQDKKTYSASEIGQLLRLANANNLKTEEYGELYRNKSPYSSKRSNI